MLWRDWVSLCSSSLAYVASASCPYTKYHFKRFVKRRLLYLERSAWCSFLSLHGNWMEVRGNFLNCSLITLCQHNNICVLFGSFGKWFILYSILWYSGYLKIISRCWYKPSLSDFIFKGPKQMNGLKQKKSSKCMLWPCVSTWDDSALARSCTALFTLFQHWYCSRLLFVTLVVSGQK